MYKVCLQTKNSVPSSVFWDSRLYPTDILVLGMYMGNDDINSIADSLGITVAQVQYSINNLIQAGYLKIQSTTQPKTDNTVKKSKSTNYEKTVDTWMKTCNTIPKELVEDLRNWVLSIFQSGKGMSFISFNCNCNLLIKYTDDIELCKQIINNAILKNHATLKYVIDEDKNSKIQNWGKNINQEFPTQQQVPPKDTRKEELYSSIIHRYLASYKVHHLEPNNTQEAIYSDCGISLQDFKNACNKLIKEFNYTEERVLGFITGFGLSISEFNIFNE